jgi:hypothetical protein
VDSLILTSLPAAAVIDLVAERRGTVVLVRGSHDNGQGADALPRNRRR